MYSQIQVSLFVPCMLRCIFRTKATRSTELKRLFECVDANRRVASLYEKALLYANNICFKDFYGKYTYLQLYANSKRVSTQVSNICGSGSNSTVAYFSSNDVMTAVILWANWMSGQQVLILNHDLEAHQYTDLLKKTKVRLIISSDLHEQHSKNLSFENSIPLMHIDHKFLNNEYNRFCKTVLLNEAYNNSEAIIMCTNEIILKTIVLTHIELDTELKNRVQSWAISKNDKILYVCPSFCSYINEYIFNLLPPLSVGSQLYILTPFDSKAVWRALLGINISSSERINALIAEPKVYRELILEYYKMFAGNKRVADYIKEYCIHNIRFMVSCYRFDPKISSTWLKITGHSLQANFYSIQSSANTKDVIAHDEREQTSSKKINYIMIRIVDAKNNVLLEFNRKDKRFANFSTTVIGRLMISNNNAFSCTGEIVYYYNGNFKIIGRYVYDSK